MSINRHNDDAIACKFDECKVLFLIGLMHFKLMLITKSAWWLPIIHNYPSKEGQMWC